MGFASDILQREIIDLLATGATTLEPHEFVVGGDAGNEQRRLQADDWTEEALPVEGQHLAAFDADEGTLVLLPVPVALPTIPEEGTFVLTATDGVLSWVVSA